jgi:hypothetical protein
MENQNGNVFTFNRNDKQFMFNEIKGCIAEKNDDEKWCSITINVGHENPRLVNLAIKKIDFDKFNAKYLIGDKVIIRYYLTSRLKNERWYTTANILQIDAS